MTMYNADPVSDNFNDVKTFSINEIIEEYVHSIEINSMEAECPKDSTLIQHDGELDPLKEVIPSYLM
ncbi:MAG: hypothetical protein QW364_01735 [Thermoplasmatales archaeon]